MTVGERIKKRRQSLHLSVMELARRAGLDRRRIWAYETGRVDLRLFEAACIADVLGLTLDELAGKKGPYIRPAEVYCPKCGTAMLNT